jgi:hypothetical protein
LFQPYDKIFPTAFLALHMTTGRYQMTTGYDELSTLMGSFPELMIFRQFRSLAAKVLLCMQADLLDVEDDLCVIREMELEDSTKHELLRSWAQASAATSEGGRNRRVLKVAQAQNKLEKYCR